MTFTVDPDVDVRWLSEAELEAAVLGTDRDRFVAEARELEAIGEFDARQAYAHDGAINTGLWLALRGDVSKRAANRMVRDARLVRAHPAALAAAYRFGTTRVLTFLRRLNPRTEAAYVANEAEILDTIGRFTVDQIERYAAAWRHVHDQDGPEPPEEKPSLAMGRSGNGVHVKLSLFGDDAAAFATAIADEADAIWRTETPGERLDPTVRNAEALMNLVRKAMGADDRYTAPARPTVVMHLTLDELEGRAGGARIAEIDPFGQPLSRAAVDRLLCDCDLHRFITGPGGVVLDLGYSERTVKGYQRLALIARDRHCTFPGCDRPPSMCHAHHVIPWERNGPTDLPNLALLCSRHHHAVHEGGFGCTRQPDGTLEFRRPDGTLLTEPRPD